MQERLQCVGNGVNAFLVKSFDIKILRKFGNITAGAILPCAYWRSPDMYLIEVPILGFDRNEAVLVIFDTYTFILVKSGIICQTECISMILFLHRGKFGRNTWIYFQTAAHNSLSRIWPSPTQWHHWSSWPLSTLITRNGLLRNSPKPSPKAM